MFELILWGIVFAVLVIAELSTTQLISIWFAVGALGAFIAAVFCTINSTVCNIYFIILVAFDFYKTFFQ